MTLETTTITGLPDATTPLSGTERVPMDQAGETKDASTQDIANLSGAAITAAVAAHEAAADPHPSYLTPAEANAAYDPINAASSAVTAHVAEADPHTQYAQTADLGTAALRNVGTSAGNVVQLDNDGKLPAVDGSQLTNLPPAGGAVTSVTATAPVTSSGGTTPVIGISAATTSAAGSMSGADKAKLDGIQAGAQVNVGTNLTYDANSREVRSDNGTDATLPLFTTAHAGLVPAATGGGTTNFLRADGTFAAPPGGTPGGSSGQLQFNNGGAFGGVSTSSIDGSGNMTFSGRWIQSVNGAASAPPLALTGTWFTGGTSTTTKPHLLIEPAGATSTAWSTSGTGLGVNAASSFTGRLLDLQLNGTSNFNVDSTGRVSFPLGTAALPALYPGTDTNTGTWSPAADTLAWSTNGVERARITSDGKVGIGTTSPASELHIANAAGNAEVRIGNSQTFDHSRIFTATDDLTISNQRTANLILRTAATERARIDSSGRLLVGTATNTGGSRLQVNDNRIRVATAKTPASATDTGAQGEICWDADYIYVCIATNTWKRAALSTWP